MVDGLSFANVNGGMCEVCMKGKHNRENIPKISVWRASKGLKLVYNDICCPIMLASESGNRYIINFIDDSRKCWTDRGGEFNSKEFQEYCKE